MSGDRRPWARPSGRIGALVAVLAAAAVVAVVALDHHSTPVRARSASAPAPRSARTAPAAETRPRRRAPAMVRNAVPQPGWRQFTGPVPILVYHALGDPPPGAPYPGLYVSRAEFRAEMAWLARSGYQGVTLDEVERAWYHHGTLPRKPIVITFDNGYPAQATFAPAVLAGYGWPGVLFEITLHHLRPGRIERLVARGWEVGSHSATHPDLTALTGAQLAYEVTGSRRFLRRTFSIAADNFCYPSSKYDSTTIAAVRAAGYVGAVTETPGYAVRSRPYELNRYEIERGQGVAGLATDLRGGS